MDPYCILLQECMHLLVEDGWLPCRRRPFERLFIVAGLTIANDRARLLTDNAADLIFLREALSLLLENLDAS